MEREVNSLPAAVRPAFLRIFRAVLKDLRFGHPTGNVADPCENFGAGFFTATTPASANAQFAISHGFGRTPYLLVPCLPLDTIGAQIVPLTVERAADDKRIYLSSSATNAPLTVYVEG